MRELRVAYDPLPVARWAALFHVLLLEQPDLCLKWLPVSFPRRGRSRLDGAHVGLFLEPRDEPQLRSLPVGASGMVVLVAVGHRLARHHELGIAEILDEPFPGGADLHPGWTAFWTLDAYRAGPPRSTRAEVSTAEQVIAAVAAGRVIATYPAMLADGLTHPGVISIPLLDAPTVTMRLVWRPGEPNRDVRALLDIALDMFDSTLASDTGDWPAPDVG
jgi:DNA-binding transcriptional LysR family regulator